MFQCCHFFMTEESTHLDLIKNGINKQEQFNSFICSLSESFQKKKKETKDNNQCKCQQLNSSSIDNSIISKLNISQYFKGNSLCHRCMKQICSFCEKRDVCNFNSYIHNLKEFKTFLEKKLNKKSMSSNFNYFNVQNKTRTVRLCDDCYQRYQQTLYTGQWFFCQDEFKTHEKRILDFINHETDTQNFRKSIQKYETKVTKKKSPTHNNDDINSTDIKNNSNSVSNENIHSNEIKTKLKLLRHDLAYLNMLL